MTDPELAIRCVNETSYVATLGGVEVGWASVAVSGSEWEIYRTVTAPEYEGRGVASRLTRFVLDAAEEANVTVIPSCWYVDGLMTRSSPRYDHLRTGHQTPTSAPGSAAGAAAGAAAGSAAGDVCRIAPTVLPRSSALP